MTINIEEKDPTLCLNMIVKNEEKIILRLITSVLPIIDTYCICDTGCTDNTIEIIETFFKSKNISGKIVREPFQNFEYNRNFALNSCDDSADYILLLDADMTLKIGDFNKKILLNLDTINILQGNDDFYYANLRIIKNDKKNKYIGVTHEYLSSPDNAKYLLLDKKTLFINDIGDGGCKGNKYQRDIELLLKGIEDEPTNERYHFYLANSYYDTCDYENAIPYYKKRIDFGGWEQELWYSNYRIGLSYSHMNKLPEAVYYWLEAYHVFPERIENLYEIMKYYSYISKQKIAKIFYDLAVSTLNKNYKRDKFLFLQNDIYTYKLYYEYMVLAYYIQIKDINDELILVLNNCNNSQTLNSTLSNYKFYKTILTPLEWHDFNNKILQVINTKQVLFNSSSSCIIPNPYEKGYLLNIRYVNYNIDNNGGYHDCDGHIITLNKYIKLSDDFSILSENMMEFNFVNKRYIGLEDVRIYYDKYSDKLKCVGTGLHDNGHIGVCDGEYDINTNKILNLRELKSSFNNEHCEKNWVLFDYNESTHIVYKWHPLTICNINENSSKLEVVETRKTPKMFSLFRGSTCGYKYNNEVWFVVHIVSYEQPRYYYHCIVVFDDKMNLLRYTTPFNFEGEPIEYSLSIIVENDKIIMTQSSWDRTTKLVVYDKHYIEKLLKYTK
jgi:hypothetical protein